MQIAIIKNNAVEIMGEHRELFSNVSFPETGPSSDWMSENSVMPVTMSRSYDRMTQKSTSVDPYIESGVVYLHKIEDLTDSLDRAASIIPLHPHCHNPRHKLAFAAINLLAYQRHGTMLYLSIAFLGQRPVDGSSFWK